MASEAEIAQIADSIRKMTGVPGVCILVLAGDGCPFGYSLAAEYPTLRTELPGKLREVAAILEREREKPGVPS